MSSREIRIIFICEHSFPDGGAQSVRINSMVNGISDYVKFVNLFCKNYINKENYKWNKSVIINKNINKNYNYFHKFLYKNIFSIRMFVELSKSKFKKKETTLVYLSTASPITLILISLICRFKGYRIIVDIGEWFPINFDILSHKIYSYTRHVVYRWISGKVADYIVAISTFIEKKYINSNARIIVIPAIASYAEKSNQIAKKDVLFYPGTLKKEDGFSNLLLALYKLYMCGSSIKLITSGSFTEDKIKNCCISVGIPVSYAKENIIHMGWLPTKEYNNLLKTSSLVLLPRPLEFNSNIASFPTRLAESLSQASSVAIANIGDVKIYLRPDIDFLNLKNGTIDEIYSALEFWNNNRTQFEKIGLNGYNYSKKHFDLEINMKRLASFIAD